MLTLILACVALLTLILLFACFAVSGRSEEEAERDEARLSAWLTGDAPFPEAEFAASDRAPARDGASDDAASPAPAHGWAFPLKRAAR